MSNDAGLMISTKHSISLYVANKPGVLNRIALVFARRGFNIDSLVVSEAHDPVFSRMSICATGDRRTLDQILRQLNKLVDVVHAIDHTGENTVEREMALVKINCTAQQRTEVMQLVHVFRCDIVDISETSLTFQATGSSEKLDAVHTMFDPYGVLEIIRTGKIVIARGESTTT